jgi:hypothetical protein
MIVPILLGLWILASKKQKPSLSTQNQPTMVDAYLK